MTYYSDVFHQFLHKVIKLLFLSNYYSRFLIQMISNENKSVEIKIDMFRHRTNKLITKKTRCEKFLSVYSIYYIGILFKNNLV